MNYIWTNHAEQLELSTEDEPNHLVSSEYCPMQGVARHRFVLTGEEPLDLPDEPTIAAALVYRAAATKDPCEDDEARAKNQP